MSNWDKERMKEHLQKQASVKALAIRGAVRLRRLQLETMRGLKKTKGQIDPQNDPVEMEEEVEAIEKLVEGI